jgi:hypothetical protein
LDLLKSEVSQLIVKSHETLAIVKALKILHDLKGQTEEAKALEQLMGGEKIKASSPFYTYSGLDSS